MEWRSRGIVFALLLWVFLSAFSWAQEAPTSSYQGVNSLISEQELQRLIEISERLRLLNERLRSELASSRQESETLRSGLEALKGELSTSKSEAESLRNESQTLRIELEGLKTRLGQSLSRSSGLSEALMKAEDSLRSLNESWTKFESEANKRTRILESRVRGMELQRNAAIAVAGVLLVLLVVR